MMEMLLDSKEETRLRDSTANVIAVKFTGFPCVPLEPCKVHVFITGKWVVC